MHIIGFVRMKKEKDFEITDSLNMLS